MTIEEQRQELIKEISAYNDVAILLQQPGWQVVSNYFNDSITLLKNKLLTEQDFKEIVRLQERFKAYSAIPNLIQSLANLKDQKADVLKEFDELHNFNQNYGLS